MGAASELIRCGFYTVDGDKLVIKTEPNKSPVDGREGVGILTFERVKPSAPSATKPPQVQVVRPRTCPSCLG
jgi:hypothetical protein